MRERPRRTARWGAVSAIAVLCLLGAVPTLPSPSPPHPGPRAAPGDSLTPPLPSTAPNGPGAAWTDCTHLHPADLIPLRAAERSYNAFCSAEHRPVAELGKGSDLPSALGTAAPVGFGIYNLAMTYDAADGYVLLLGATGIGPLNGTQTWTFHNGNWTERFPTASPESCMGSSLAYDSADGYVVYLGGANLGYGANCSSAGETWTFLAGNWTKLTPSPAPPARQAAAMTNDSADGYLLLFGGLSPSCGGVCNDTWTFTGGTWTQQRPSTAPSNRSGAGMVYDPVDGYVLLFGGSSSTGSRTGGGCTGPYQDSVYCMDRDTWAYRSGTWTQLSPTGPVPPEPYDDGLTWDGADNSALYTVTDDNRSSDPEIWWTFAGGNWTDPLNNSASDYNSSLPVNRFGEGLAYDWADGYAVMFGGAGVTWNWLNDTWTYRASTWTDLTQYGPPPPKYQVWLNETGLPADTLWSATLGGVTSSTTGASLVFSEPNGSYGFTVPAVPGFQPSVGSGTVDVRGVLVGVLIPFTATAGPPTYNVTFVASGLPAGTVWSVTINGTASGGVPAAWSNGTYGTSGSELVVSLPNGTGTYSVGPVPGYAAVPMGGGLTVDGAGLTIAVTFSATTAPVRVTFVENGLPNGTDWAVTLGGVIGNSTGDAVSFGVLPGTYSYQVGALDGFTPAPANGTVTVTTDTVLYIGFTPNGGPGTGEFALVFSETGLPGGIGWSVMTDGNLSSTNGTSIVVTVQNGTHAFTAYPPYGFVSTPGAGSVTVVGGGLTVPLLFTPVRLSVPPPVSPAPAPSVGMYLAIGVGSTIVVVGDILAIALAVRSSSTRPGRPPPGGPGP